MLFGESLKTLLENYKFRNGRSVVVKDFTLENFENLDVLLLDYESFVMKQTMNSIYKFINFVNPFLPNPLSVNKVKNQLKEYHLTNLKILDNI